MPNSPPCRNSSIRPPVRLGHDACEEPDDRRDADTHQLQPRHHRGAIPGNRIVGPAVGTNTGRVRYASASAPKTMDPTSRPHHEEDDELGEQLRGEDRAITQLAEPQPVDVAVDEPGPNQQQQHDRHGDRRIRLRRVSFGILAAGRIATRQLRSSFLDV